MGSVKKLEKMRTAIDVIRRWQWDENADVESCTVGYFDRVLDGIVEKKLTAFSHWGSIEAAGLTDLAIP